MLIFDILKLYIVAMDQENIKLEIVVCNIQSEKDCEKDHYSFKELKYGMIIPFFLFWIGILTPIVTDNALIWAISLIPFYGFVFFSSIILDGKIDETAFAAAALLNVITSILLLVLLFFLPDGFEGLKDTCRLAAINIFPALIFLLAIIV